jgi:hypothetical protein
MVSIFAKFRSKCSDRTCYSNANYHNSITMRLSSAAIHRLAENTVIHRRTNRATRMSRERFASFFGCSPTVAAHVWNRIQVKLLHATFTAKHLLWTLAFLKLYNSEAVLASMCRCTEKTLRKWVWIGVDVLESLDLVRVCRLPSFVVLRVVQSLLPTYSALSLSLSPFIKDQVEQSVQARCG